MRYTPGFFSLLVAAMLCSALLLGVTASAAEADASMPLFPDVRADDWFASDVMLLAESGIINGFLDGLFHPEQPLTTAQFIKLLICALGEPEQPEPDYTSSGSQVTVSGFRLFPEHWAAEHLTDAYSRKIISDPDLVNGLAPDQPITRADMTRYMIRALGIDTAQIDDPFTDISDEYASTAYKEYLLRGYIQPDGTRTYNGSGFATRAEAAAIIVRVIEYRYDSYSYKRSAILTNAAENPLTTESELVDLFYVLNREFMTEFEFRTNVSTQILRSCYETANVINLEYFYSSSAAIRSSGGDRYRIELRFTPDADTVRALHNAAADRAREIISYIVSDDMSDESRIKAIHDYLILNCEYDYENYRSGNVTYESRLAYGALINKSAVCQGYCAAFSLLCEYAGVKCIVVAGNAPNSPDTHAWNLVLIDGEPCFIDVTHDDPVPDRNGRVSYRYYLMSEIEMESYGYVWDKESADLKYFY